MTDSVDEQAKNALKSRYAEYEGCGGWKALADELGENEGFLWRIAKGKRPCPDSIRRKLGLPTRVVISSPADIVLEDGADVRVIGSGKAAQRVIFVADYTGLVSVNGTVEPVDVEVYRYHCYVCDSAFWSVSKGNQYGPPKYCDTCRRSGDARRWRRQRKGE